MKAVSWLPGAFERDWVLMDRLIARCRLRAPRKCRRFHLLSSIERLTVTGFGVVHIHVCM